MDGCRQLELNCNLGFVVLGKFGIKFIPQQHRSPFLMNTRALSTMAELNSVVSDAYMCVWVITGSVGLILRGVWSSFLVLMLWAVLLDALFFTSISAAAKQLWPFCVTGDFPQALTNCYSLSSPICHLKCYLENVNWSYNAVEWRDVSPHPFLSSSQMIDSQIRENGNLNRLCVVENVFPN